jgi:hypothetical protein
MVKYFSSLVADDLKLGYDVVNTGMHGYVGKRSRHGMLLANGDRALLQVSGERAQRTVLLCRAGDSCSRIDVQVTLRIAPGQVQRFLAAAKQLAEQPRHTRGVRPKVTYRGGEDGIETVYIGKPKSDLQIRLYDKFRESKKEVFKDCVRFEAQFRNKKAKAIWEEMARGAHGTMWLCNMLFHVLERANIDTSYIPLPRSYIRPPSTEPPKEAVTLAWHRTQVAPTIARLAREHPWYLLFENLFAGVLTRHDMQAIISWGTLHYGN